MGDSRDPPVLFTHRVKGSGTGMALISQHSWISFHQLCEHFTLLPGRRQMHNSLTDRPRRIVSRGVVGIVRAGCQRDAVDFVLSAVRIAHVAIDDSAKS